MKKFILLAATATLLSSTPVMASDTEQVVEPLDEAETLALDAKFYSQAYGVSEEEAARRILIMHGTAEEVANIENEFGNRLAGIYFDNSNDFGLKVRLTGDAVPAERKLIRAAKRADRREARQDERRTARRAERRAERRATRQQLGITDAAVEKAEDLIEEATESKVSFRAESRATRQNRRQQIRQNERQLKRAISGFEMALDDEETGETVIYVKTNDGSAAQKAEAILGNPVRVEVIPTGIQATHTRGGSRITQSNGNWYCMSGFTVKRTSDNQLGVLTAGHCLDPADPNTPSSFLYKDRDGSSYAITPVPGTIFNDSIKDIAFMTANHAAVGEFYADSTATPRKLTATRSRSSTTQAAGTTKGSFICHLGQTSPTNSTLIQSCGEVQSIAGANHKGGNTYVVVRNTATGAGTAYNPSGTSLGTLRCVRGDSGGPWFAYTTAYGIQSACSWYDTAETKTATVIYTSIDYASSIGVSVVK